MRIAQRPGPLLALLTMAIALGLPCIAAAAPESYVMDTKGGHASINFRIKHLLSYSWLYGRFNDFSGKFAYDEDSPKDSTVEVTINTASIDSNHAERDKHLRDKDFLDVSRYPTATFKSTSYQSGIGGDVLKGELTLHGITKPITLQVERMGNGPDPWGGYRRGFLAHTEIALKDFGIKGKLGPASTTVELTLSVEGIRQ